MLKQRKTKLLYHYGKEIPSWKEETRTITIDVPISYLDRQLKRGVSFTCVIAKCMQRMQRLSTKPHGAVINVVTRRKRHEA